MTAPVLDVPVEQSLYEEPPDVDSYAAEAIIAALIAYFASQAAISASLLPLSLVRMLVALGFAPKAVRAAGKLALSVPMAGRSRFGTPSLPAASWVGPNSEPTPSMARRVASDEPRMRARYVYNAARRLTTRLVAGSFLAGLKTEQTHLGAHVAAGRNRHAAAQNLDQVAEGNPFLKWVSVMDDRTTYDCAVLNGVVFTMENPPGLPGAMHPKCRCYARAIADFDFSTIWPRLAG